jgi:hypothetical protein
VPLDEGYGATGVWAGYSAEECSTVGLAAEGVAVDCVTSV